MAKCYPVLVLMAATCRSGWQDEVEGGRAVSDAFSQEFILYSDTSCAVGFRGFLQCAFSCLPGYIAEKHKQKI